MTVARRRAGLRTYLWIILGAIVLLIALGVSYKPKIQSGWVVNCSNDKCIASGHFHYDLSVSICRQAISLPAEAGELASQHSHKESNKIHWHSTVPYEKQTGPKLDGSMTVARTLQDLAIDLPENCNEVPASTALTINGIARPETYLTSYNWQDGDIIEVEVF